MPITYTHTQCHVCLPLPVVILNRMFLCMLHVFLSHERSWGTANERMIPHYPGFRTRKARVRKCNQFPRQKGGHGPRHSMRRPRKLETRTRHYSLMTEFNVLQRKFWQVSRLIYTFISHTKMSIFFWKGRSSSFILESQPGTLMLETFLWDNNVNWADRGTDKNGQSMTSCGFCCYYLEHCSKTNHIAIKLINTKTSMDS